MSVSSFDDGESPIRPLDFVSFLLSPKGVDAIRKAYTPPATPIVLATAHNRNIIQNALRIQTPAYVILIICLQQLKNRNFGKTP